MGCQHERSLPAITWVAIATPPFPNDSPTSPLLPGWNPTTTTCYSCFKRKQCVGPHYRHRYPVWCPQLQRFEHVCVTVCLHLCASKWAHAACLTVCANYLINGWQISVSTNTKLQWATSAWQEPSQSLFLSVSLSLFLSHLHTHTHLKTTEISLCSLSKETICLTAQCSGNQSGVTGSAIWRCSL